jgi:polysaccharide pyruvyl transferase CsaB
MHKKRILFLGTHGQYNIGDELLLETFLAQLGDEHQYCVNSYNPSYTQNQLGGRYAVTVFSTHGEQLRLLNYIWKADLLFFGGGSIIKELYASVGRNRYATLIMILLIVTFACRIARKPVMMSNIGVGPLQTKWGDRLARLILRQVAFLSVRDRASYNTCLRLGIDPMRLRLVPDAVFVLDPNTLTAVAPEQFSGCPGIQPKKLKVALNLNYNIENPDNWENFLASLASALCAYHAKQPIEIHALPMQSGFKANDDYQVLSEFRRRIPEMEVHLHRPEDHQQVAAILAGCDLIVAERLHTLVLATILNKPFLALMYDIKVRELTAGLKMTGFAIDINRPFAPAALAEKLDHLWGHYETVQEHLAGSAISMRTELREYFATVQGLLKTLS